MQQDESPAGTAGTAGTAGLIGWLGLGAMGSPMSLRLTRSGYRVQAFDPSPDRAAALGPAVTAAPTPAAAASGADMVVVMVASPGQAENAMFGADGAVAGLRPGTSVVVLSTLGPAWVRELSGRLPEGVRLVDAPVSGGVSRAVEGTLLIMAAGAEPVDRKVLGALGEVVTVGTTPGQGQAMKMVNQVLCGVHIAAAAEALTLAESLGIDPQLAWETVRRGAAASFMLDDRGERMVAPTGGPVRSAVGLFVKDLHLVLAEAAATGLPMSVVAAAAGVFDDAADAGLAAHDDSELFDHLLRRRGAAGGARSS